MKMTITFARAFLYVVFFPESQSTPQTNVLPVVLGLVHTVWKERETILFFDVTALACEW